VLALAGEFDALVADGFGFAADFVEGKVGPLSGKQRNGSRHDFSYVVGVYKTGADGRCQIAELEA